MRKLNWYWAYYPYLDAPEQQKESALHAGYIKVVSKDEADKVIAEKDAEIARLKAIRKVHVKAIESMGAGLQQDEEVILHHKYKRCLDKAALCERMRIDAADYRIHREKWEFYDKWHRRYLELAEEFKEAKRCVNIANRTKTTNVNL